jgi:hypothetical protein
MGSHTFVYRLASNCDPPDLQLVYSVYSWDYTHTLPCQNYNSFDFFNKVVLPDMAVDTCNLSIMEGKVGRRSSVTERVRGQRKLHTEARHQTQGLGVQLHSPALAWHDRILGLISTATQKKYYH